MSDSDSAQLKMVRVEIKGVVQGVCYRDWAVEHATELGLNGWVRNRNDGSVEAVFCGSCDKVDEMQQLCRRGPNAAMVTSLDSFPCNEDPGSGFERRPTVDHLLNGPQRNIIASSYNFFYLVCIFASLVLVYEI